MLCRPNPPPPRTDHEQKTVYNKRGCYLAVKGSSKLVQTLKLGQAYKKKYFTKEHWFGN